jgi:DNA-directed RNA polymerase specialized sigma24 family protein
VLNDFAKKNAREQVSFDSEAASRYSEATADDSLDHDKNTEYERELAFLKKLLPPLYFAALVLCKRDGLSHGEVGKVIGRSSETARKYISEAIARHAVARKHVGTRGTVK